MKGYSESFKYHIPPLLSSSANGTLLLPNNNDNDGNLLPLSYNVLDALSKLFLLLIRLADKEASDVSVRVNLLNRILNAIAKALLDDHETKKNVQARAMSGGAPGPPFDQRPYHRLFANLMADLGSPDSKQEVNVQLFPSLTTYFSVSLTPFVGGHETILIFSKINVEEISSANSDDTTK